jgi:hypothetical protein
MSAQTLLSGGDKWYSYSGEVTGDVSVPASIQMVLIPNTGLRDSYVKIQPFYGLLVSDAQGSQLGIQVKLDDVIIMNIQQYRDYDSSYRENVELFIPRQSKLEIISLNTSVNNTQVRGVNVIGYYL